MQSEVFLRYDVRVVFPFHMYFSELRARATRLRISLANYVTANTYDASAV